MNKTVRDYQADARSDAWDTVREYVDEMVEQFETEGEVSDDLLNDYNNGDGYHHEQHVDKDYDLLDAAELLDQLSEYEETDSGLWEGLEPRKAIAVQAAFTYGAAVYDYWRILIEDLNDCLSDLALPETGDADADEETRRRLGKVLIQIYAVLGEKRESSHGEEATLMAGAWESMLGGDLTGLLALADWYEEHDDTYTATALRRTAATIINSY